MGLPKTNRYSQKKSDQIIDKNDDVKKNMIICLVKYYECKYTHVVKKIITEEQYPQ